ncbi:hypothetical protein F5Y16DRAFT_416001 [Xylariaceae sp. FL0255]|nr:hypothetical protein F5Y16DRAFT_416001 [Xylariaceae sp. FL0255]
MEATESDCPTCGLSPQKWRSDSEASSGTHDTSASSYHIPLPKWLQQFDQAVQSAWPKRFIGYTQVAVLMICWEETYEGERNALKTEFRRLRSVFQDVYNYAVSRFKIPSTDPDRAIYKRIDQFLDDYGHPENLLIVYYTGHARRNPSGGSFPIWQPRSEEEKGKQIDTATFHPLLVRAEDNSPDVLLLYDCCFSLSSHRSNSNNSKVEVEGLFAGGFESQVPIPGQDSFTKHLTDALAIAPESGRVLTIAELHRQIIVRLQSFHQQAIFDENHMVRRCNRTGKILYTKSVRVTPSHLFLAGNEKPRFIVLRPLRTEKSEERKQLEPKPETDKEPKVKVLLAVRLLNDDNIIQELEEWIIRAPSGVQELKFQWVFPSFSSLLLIEVPLTVWDLLPPSPAVTFVSFTIGLVKNVSPQPQLRRMPTMLDLRHGNQGDVEITDRVKLKLPHHLRTQSSIQSFTESEPPSVPGHKLFSPRTDSEDILLYLLDRADVHILKILQDWRALETDEKRSRDDWLIREFSKKLMEDSKNPETQYRLAKFPREHKEFISRYLSTHELLSHDNPVINISSRLNPLFKWKSGLDPDAFVGSETDLTTALSSTWTSPEKNSSVERPIVKEPSVNDSSVKRFRITEGTRIGDDVNQAKSLDNDPHPIIGSSLQEGLDNARDPLYGSGIATGMQYQDVSFAAPKLQATDYGSSPRPEGNDYIPRGPGFRVEASNKFQPGVEPSDKSEVNSAGNRFYVGYRRFIIVAADESGHSTCVPVLTYDRKGCGKRGVKPDAHGIAYASGGKPRPLKNEPTLGYNPIGIELEAEGESLARESRVNYSKLVAIEQNVRVFIIGRVAPDVRP